MPLPRAGNAQEQEKLEALYDRLAEKAMVELLKKLNSGFDPKLLAEASYSIATAMLNERNKK